MAKQERLYLTAVSIVAGIINLIDMDGQIVTYRQRGIQKYSDKQLKVLMSQGLLDPRWKMYKELPKHISIYFEDPEVMGKAQATYPNPEKIAKQLSDLTALRVGNSKPVSNSKSRKK